VLTAGTIFTHDNTILEFVRVGLTACPLLILAAALKVEAHRHRWSGDKFGL